MKRLLVKVLIHADIKDRETIDEAEDRLADELKENDVVVVGWLGEEIIKTSNF